MYSTMVESALGRFSAMTESMMDEERGDGPLGNEMCEENTLIYRDELIRKRNVNGSYQEDLLSVRVKLYSPHPSVGVFEIDEVNEMNLSYMSGSKKLKKL